MSASVSTFVVLDLDVRFLCVPGSCTEDHSKELSVWHARACLAGSHKASRVFSCF